MSGQAQQQATVVQLPIVIDGRYKKQPPYVLRGYKFANGVTCPGTCFVLLISFGGIFTFFVIVCYVMGASLFGAIPAVFIVLSAVASVVIGSYFCVGARRQFKALAHDHPDRYKYGTGYVLPIIPPQPAAPPATNDTLASYNLPHGAQGQGSANPSPSFQGPPGGNVYILHGSPGSKISLERPTSADFSFQGHRVGYPGQAGPNPAYPPPSPTAQPYDGRTTRNYPMAPEDDPPPPYSEIEKNNRY